MRRYEAVFIFQDGADDESLAAQIEAVRAEAVKLDGNVCNVTRMGKNVFARPLKKKGAGIFVLMIFEMAPEKIKLLNERYKSNQSVLRFHIVVSRACPEASAQSADGDIQA